ncbi:uncharacterized protein MAM_08118 [Metarhizium album ARSEF 1941]|uniref:Uncharacterized protein n=1 Tax=Metarhizium album (strain ARSEF 1941) TaxID=1081103 RepID=A0A0B2WK16_METAS|nr:uncharacterized protein MAM_08118 [Metarhizium album ARSEF 1941]KHN94044.1 hypothetical protein MAM_08118 [Metarhizium album ARSEF 1941]
MLQALISITSPCYSGRLTSGSIEQAGNNEPQGANTSYDHGKTFQQKPRHAIRHVSRHHGGPDTPSGSILYGAPSTDRTSDCARLTRDAGREGGRRPETFSPFEAAPAQELDHDDEDLEQTTSFTHYIV